MNEQPSHRSNRILATATGRLLLVTMLFAVSCVNQSVEARTEEIVFHSDSFEIVGELRLPAVPADHGKNGKGGLRDLLLG